jgi:hypothetical protein
MTTVSVSIYQVGTNDRLYLHNGMRGPATAVLHYMSKACEDGTIESDDWNIAELDVITTGTVVRAALDKTDGYEDHYWRYDNRERFAAFRASVQDDAKYEVHAIEC